LIETHALLAFVNESKGEGRLGSEASSVYVPASLLSAFAGSPVIVKFRLIVLCVSWLSTLLFA
jgi:hypothetical protein